jgi:hypothetical protein
MPLTPLPADNTDRYKVNYTAVGFNHDFQVRTDASASAGGLGSVVGAFLTALAPQLYPVLVQTVEFAVAGSGVFNPVTTGIEGVTYGTGSPAPLLAPQFIGFQGRTSGGRKVRLSVFGIRPEENDYRFDPGDNSDIDAAINVLQGASHYFLGIDGVVPLWYDYSNTGFNAYWQRKLRG